MILSVAGRGDKIILPRNVHRSVMGAMVLCGAVPVYVDPASDEHLGISLGMRVQDVRRAIEKNPDAKAILVNNPTYYGICSDLRGIVQLAHCHGMLCLRTCAWTPPPYPPRPPWRLPASVPRNSILAYLSIGDRVREIERLISALADLKRRFGRKDRVGLMRQEYIEPQVAVSPQEAFYAPKESLPLEKTMGRVCSEFVMCYPPGIPILAPGERITQAILDYIVYAKEKGCSMTGPEDLAILSLNVLKGGY